MKAGLDLTKTGNEVEVETIDRPSVCNSPEEQQKLLKLFEILIKVDKRLKQQNHEHN